jgi:cytochrome c556
VIARSILASRRAVPIVVCATALGLATVAVTRAQQPAPPAGAQGQPGQKPEPAGAKPQEPGAKPAEPGAKPAEPGAKPAEPGAKPAAPAAKPLIPLVASTLIAKPDVYYGESVTMMATVDQTLSPTAFSMDQDKATSEGKDVLVLAPRLNEPVELNTYVTVIGDVVKFDPADAQVKGLLTGLAPDVLAKYTGRPAIVARSVINPAMNDVARRLPPKMTAEEEAFQKVMQKVGAANGAFRAIIEKSDAEGAKEQSAALKSAFEATQQFFDKHDKKDAVGWAQDAYKIASTIELATASGKWDEAKASAGSLGKMCQTCHTAYRERYDDGSFRAKVGPNWAKPGN